MKEIKIIVMVGLQGSGKSTFAGQIRYPHYYYSADVIRILHPDWDNEAVFKYLHNELKDLFCLIGREQADNNPIFIDNTNTTRKARRSLFMVLNEFEASGTGRLLGIKFSVDACVMTTPLGLCKLRIKRREESTGKHIPD